MVYQIVQQVITDTSNRRVSAAGKPHPLTPSPQGEGERTQKKQITGGGEKTPKKRTRKKKDESVKEGDVCPKCGKGHIIKGKTAYGCSEWKNGCDWRQPFGE